MDKQKVLNRQSVADVAIHRCGDLSSAFELALLNGTSLTDDLEAGREITLPPIRDKRTVSYFEQKGMNPATAITSVEASIDDNIRIFDDSFDDSFE